MLLQEHFSKSKHKTKSGVRSLEKLRKWRGKKMRFQTTLEGAECLRRRRWMAKCSRHAAQRRRTRGHQSSYDTKMVLLVYGKFSDSACAPVLYRVPSKQPTRLTSCQATNSIPKKIISMKERGNTSCSWWQLVVGGGARCLVVQCARCQHQSSLWQTPLTPVAFSCFHWKHLSPYHTESGTRALTPRTETPDNHPGGYHAGVIGHLSHAPTRWDDRVINLSNVIDSMSSLSHCTIDVR